MLFKQVIVIRRDLKMRRGKEVAQGCHASLGAVLPNIQISDVRAWQREGCAKICVRVNSEEELLELAAKSEAAGIITHLVRDAGKTEFKGVPTLTALAIGPAYAAYVDAITGHLPLY